MTGFRIEVEVLSDHSDVGTVQAARDLLGEYLTFVQSLSLGFGTARLEEEIANLPHSYAAQGGELLLAHVGDEPAGCVGYRSLAFRGLPDACQMKRMYVRPAFQGAGVGGALGEAVLERARGVGHRRMYLDTEPHAMASAYRLYRRLGFEECAPPFPASEVGVRFLMREVGEDGERI
ncbi:GNAT family N-acetyltransferase [Deinococcus sp. YIM 134068]|uniref:GNAT family N-acetyltransferase n=1 Tax=Deinococcus lichenicola TaxID=3118910 RepID=UPI002F91F4E2